MVEVASKQLLDVLSAALSVFSVAKGQDYSDFLQKIEIVVKCHFTCENGHNCVSCSARPIFAKILYNSLY